MQWFWCQFTFKRFFSLFNILILFLRLILPIQCLVQFFIYLFTIFIDQNWIISLLLLKSSIESWFFKIFYLINYIVNEEWIINILVLELSTISECGEHIFFSSCEPFTSFQSCVDWRSFFFWLWKYCVVQNVPIIPQICEIFLLVFPVIFVDFLNFVEFLYVSKFVLNLRFYLHNIF